MLQPHPSGLRMPGLQQEVLGQREGAVEGCSGIRTRLKMDRPGVKVQAVCTRLLWNRKGRGRPGRAVLTLSRGGEWALPCVPHRLQELGQAR